MALLLDRFGRRAGGSIANENGVRICDVVEQEIGRLIERFVCARGLKSNERGGDEKNPEMLHPLQSRREEELHVWGRGNSMPEFRRCVSWRSRLKLLS